MFSLNLFTFTILETMIVESAERNLPLSTMRVNLFPKLSARLLSCSIILAEKSAGAGTLFP